MTRAWFVTGTDTEIGKTFITAALLHVARNQGCRAAGMKPVAAGTDADGRNEDVEALLAASNVALPRSICNPFLLPAAVAPHIAAAASGVRIDPAIIETAFADLRARAEIVLVEGVGGFRVPLGEDFDSADLAVRLGLPVILVVGMRLGCINHALLSAEAIRARGLTLAGWVANRIDPAMLRYAENVEALRERLGTPLLGEVPFLGSGDSAEAAAFLRLPEFLP